MMLFRSLVLGLLAALVLVEVGHLHNHMHAAPQAQALPAIVAVAAPLPCASVGAACAPVSAVLSAPVTRPGPWTEAAADSYMVVDITRATVDHYLQASSLAAQARLVPTFRHGQTVGIKIYAVRPDSLFSVIGLRNGDVLETVNSFTVLGQDDYHAWQSALENPPSFLDLGVVRNGEPIRIVVLIHE